MLWDKNEIAESLPPAHRVEPPSLRAEILDELADHLACAMQRELRRTPDVKAARKAVIARFGNPASVARALWFQAMKEAIMKDRIMLMAVGVLVLTDRMTSLNNYFAFMTRIVTAAEKHLLN